MNASHDARSLWSAQEDSASEAAPYPESCPAYSHTLPSDAFQTLSTAGRSVLARSCRRRQAASKTTRPLPPACPVRWRHREDHPPRLGCPVLLGGAPQHLPLPHGAPRPPPPPPCAAHGRGGSSSVGAAPRRAGGGTARIQTTCQPCDRPSAVALLMTNTFLRVSCACPRSWNHGAQSGLGEPAWPARRCAPRSRVVAPDAQHPIRKHAWLESRLKSPP